MDPEVTAFELRSVIHDALLSREIRLNELRNRHDSALQTTYAMLTTRRAGEAFPRVIEDERGNDELETGFDEWKEQYRLEAGPSRISKLVLPDIPPLSPPATATVFPDEQPLENQFSASTSAPAAPVRPRSPRRARSPPRDSSRSPSPVRPTASMRVLQPRHRSFISFEPTQQLSVPEWIPQENYHVTQSPVNSPRPPLMALQTDYTSTLPRLPPLPPQQTAKRRKRHNKSDDRRSDLSLLQIEYKYNPLSGSLSKSSKCVLTSDWKIAQAELRHIRAMERVDVKKEQGRWSLRQPKKLKGPPVPKSHWDYLLEEMEWMRTDFAEERRWKVVEAREIAYQIVEWHLSTAKEKAAQMVGGRGWGSSNEIAVPGRSERSAAAPALDTGSGEVDDVEMLVEAAADEGEEADDAVEEGRSSQNRMDATGAEVLDEILPDKDEDVGIKQEVEDVAMTEADAEGEEDADGEVDADGEEDADGEAEADGDGEVDAEGEAEDIGENIVGLDDIPSGNSPDKHPERLSSPGPRRDNALPSGVILHKRFANVDELLVARKPILDLAFEAGVVDLTPVAGPSRLASEAPEEELVTPPLLTDLFPDLGVYAGPSPPEDGKIHKRMDEGYTSSHRVAHTSRLMDIRPILISSIQPARNSSGGSWDLRDGLWYEDPKGSTEVSEDVIASTSSVFTGRGLRPINPKHAPSISVPTAQHLRHQHVWSEEEDAVLLHLIQVYPFHWQLVADSFNSEVTSIPTDKVSAYDCWDRWYWTWGEGKDKPRPEPNQSSGTQTPGVPGVPPPSAIASSTMTPAAGSGTGTPAPTSTVPPSAGPSGRPSQTPQPQPQQTPQTGVSVPSLPAQNGTGEQATNGEAGAPPPPGLSKREARQAGKHKFEGSKKSIRHQVLYESMRRLVRRREQTKQKTSVKEQPKRVINVHESHSGYLMAQVGTPFELVEAKWQRDMREARDKQARQQQLQEVRAQVARQQQAAMLNAQQQQQQQQQAAPAGQQGQMATPQLQPGQVPQPGQGQPQMRPPAPLAPPGQRIAPNGQPIPNMAPSQQQLLTAVAAANAARQNTGANGTPVNGVRPPPHGGQNPQIQQQMQMLQAQQLAARQAQAQAAVQNHQRVPSGGTPHSQPGALAASPYSHQGGELPNGDLAHGSPAMNANGPHSSPSQQPSAMGRVPSMPMAQAPHLRVPSSGSPQMASPQPNSAGNNSINNAVMQQIVATLQASGQQPTPETIRALHMQMVRNAQAQAQAVAQQQAQAAGQVAHFARSPSITNAQAPPRGSPASQ